MRSRLVIPAAILLAAAYMKGRWDAHPEGPARRDVAPADVPPAPPAADLAAAELAATLAPAPPPVVEAEAGPRLERISEWTGQPAGPAAPPELEAEPQPGAVVEPEVVAEPEPEAVVEPEPAPEPVAVEAEATPEPEPVAIAEPESVAVVEPEAPRVLESGRFSLGGWAAATGHTTLTGVTFARAHEDGVRASAIRLVIDGGANVAEGGLVVLGDAGFAPDEEGFTLMLAAAGPGGFAASGRYEVLELP